MLEEVNELTKGNVEAVVESGKIAAKGAEALGQEAAEYSRKSFEKATATMKSFASVKSPTEFFQLQSEFFSSAFDTMASEASKNSEAMLKLAGDVAQPLSTRMSLVSEKVKSFTS
ncbi:phasin family protein [Rhizorhapis sp. SPR117]|nr:phasin family protein [Rhizorhapis sp. SPR117]